MSAKPEVFISYSWDSQEHKEWVHKLYNILRDNGVEVLIDRYEVFLGSNLEKYMRQGLNDCRYVLCVCTEGYLSKTNDPTTGVGKEAHIIKANDKVDFIIPIIKDNQDKTLPDFIEGAYYTDFSNVAFDGTNLNDVEKIKEVLVHIYNIDDTLKPQKGTNPFEVCLGRDVIINTKIRQSMYRNPELTDAVEFNYSNNNGEYSIGSGEFAFTTKWSKASDVLIHAYRDASDIKQIAVIKDLTDLPEELIDVTELDFTSRVRSPKRGDGIIWLNTAGHFAITVIRDIKDDTRDDNIDLLKFEYRIYLEEKNIFLNV